MGFEYYLFSLFIAALMCAVAIVIKVIFSNTKKQLKMLEEREAEILKTYNAVETIMEEFQDQAKATIDELAEREQEYREAIKNIPVITASEVDEQPAVQAPEKPARPLPPEEARRKAAEEVIERAEQAQKPATISMMAPLSEPVTPISVVSPKAAKEAYSTLPPKIAVPEEIESRNGKPKAAVFQKFFEEAVEAPPPTPYSVTQINGGSRKDTILELAATGKTDVEIASQLGITRNEVQMVMKMTK